MKINLPKVNILWNWNFVIALVLLVFICLTLHEFGHYMGGKALGEDVYMSFSFVFSEDWQVPPPLLELVAGPIVTYLLMYLGLFLLLFSVRFKLLGVVLVFPCGFLFSLFDETQIFSILGLEHNLIYLYKVPLMLIPAIIVYLSIANKRKYLNIGSLFIIGALFYGVLVFLIDIPFFMNPFVGEGVVFLNIFGINIYVILLTLIALALFFGKYLRYLLPTNTNIHKD